MSVNLAEKVSLSEADYLNGEKISQIKHEFIEGDIYAMAGASRNHNIISANVARQFGNHLAETPCITFTSDMKVRVDHNFYYPDILVVCDNNEDDDYYTNSPIIIVEVLSKSTRHRDKCAKMDAYRTITTLQEYVLIEQDFVEIQVCRRKNNWF
ncbi:MAG: Uma2 family endonuclease, partial [Methylococcales bacterium]|nr:Uma2 family endonuclease [Methylococcales bacterium]